MKCKIERDCSEVIQFKPSEPQDFLPAAVPAEVKELDAPFVNGASLALVVSRDGGVAFSMHGREWLSNRWGDKRLVKIEMPSGHHAVEKLANFFERCAARLRDV